MRTAWKHYPITEEDMQDWKLYVACYDALGQPSPAVWIQAWTTKIRISEAPHEMIRATNIYIMASDPKVLYVERSGYD